jgi:hypothetical protein
LLYFPEAEVLFWVSRVTVVVGLRLTGDWAKAGLAKTALARKTKIQQRCTNFSYSWYSQIVTFQGSAVF